MDLQPRVMTCDLDWEPVPVKGAEGALCLVDAPIDAKVPPKTYVKEPNKFGSWEKWWSEPDTLVAFFTSERH